MKHILFVIPTLKVGGTLSSLISIVDFLKSEWKISIQSLAYDGDPSVFSGIDILKKKRLLHAYYCSYSESRGWEKLIIIIVKTIKRISYFLNINLEKQLSKLYSSTFNNYDIIVGFQEGSSTIFVSYLNNNRKIAWVHCDYSNYNSLGNELKIYSKFSNIVCVSQYTAQTFSNMYPSLRHKVISIHNLLNTDLINQNSNYSINDKLFLNDRFTIISVGRVDPVKRFECIPNIASNLEARGCRFRWFIIGPEYGDKTFMSLKYEIEKYNVENCVIYLGAKKNPYPYFKNADLLVSLSSTEACPMIFNEAKILTLPIVTTDFGSSFEFIKNGESGVIVAFQDMIDTLFSIISNPEYYKSLKQNMSKLKYSNETILSQLRELFS